MMRVCQSVEVGAALDQSQMLEFRASWKRRQSRTLSNCPSHTTAQKHRGGENNIQGWFCLNKVLGHVMPNQKIVG